ncbi:SDR family oxidoreductase [Chitinophaga silvisoli]|uniref:SDR family NAD(P)-dependent oxidoreductase n=1 Tax=Chitinophaga silvisoli TaxID=2291814 RepID=A0A3E1NT93_9BACT|nr:SDR family oxidoreductase [Chitinophaga silvisoli]RFM31133.1 SDR family NAD(P)-dependent oxidoreductase [Chitinophaga silvisoli]
MENLANKKVLILGGSTGLGLATAKAAAAEGAIVTIVSSNQNRLNEAAQQLPPTAGTHSVDLSDEQAIRSFFAGFGHFDHLVYTAGENLSLSVIKDMDLADSRKYFDIRYWGAVAAVKYGAPLINPGGSITLTSGTAAVKPNISWSIGSSICAAMEGFTRVMALELAPVRVNLVRPGLVRSNLWDSMDPAVKDQLFDTFAQALPVKYVAYPDDIALTYIYLMKQSYSSGEVVTVDGGALMI